MMSPSFAVPTHGNPLFEQFPDYRAVLEEQWRRQVATITELSCAALSPARNEPDDDGSRMNRLHIAARLLATARHQLQETEAALARVDDGSYGLCGHCGEPIAPERLEVVPSARYCVACQARLGTAHAREKKG
jgi:RNA polymerase-binding transcription factor DksA